MIVDATEHKLIPMGCQNSNNMTNGEINMKVSRGGKSQVVTRQAYVLINPEGMAVL